MRRRRYSTCTTAVNQAPSSGLHNDVDNLNAPKPCTKLALYGSHYHLSAYHSQLQGLTVGQLVCKQRQ